MTMPTVKAVLTRADQLLATEADWYKGGLFAFRDADGSTHLRDIWDWKDGGNTPNCMCLIGAVVKARIELEGLPLDQVAANPYQYAYPYIEELSSCIFNEWMTVEATGSEGIIVSFNDGVQCAIKRDGTERPDGSTFEDIKEALACAIEKAPDTAPYAPPAPQPLTPGEL